MAICNEGEHNWHFMHENFQNEISDKEYYVVNIEPGKDEVLVRDRENRFAAFICDKCGLIRKIPIQVEIK